MIWIFNGPAVQFDLPTPPPTHGKILRLPQQIIACHPHLVIANGIDIIHMQALHGMHFSEPAHWQIDKQGIRVVYTGTPGSAWQRWLTRTTHTVMRATNTVIGPNLAWLDVHEPYQFQALFATQPAPDTTCRTQVIVFLPSQKRLIIAAISLLGVILLADRALLNNLDFHPGWTEHDATFQAFADSLNKMEAW